MSKLLVVDDSVTSLDIIVNYLNVVGGHDAEAAFSGHVAEERILGNRYDALIFDLMILDINGLDLLRWVRRMGIGTPVLIVSAVGDDELGDVVSAARDEGLGPLRVVSKSCNPPSMLLDVIREVTK